MLIIVNGSPATGKTYLIDKIAGMFSIPIFSMDHLKETILDAVKDCTPDIASKCSFEGLYYAAEQTIRNNRDVLLEANFHNTEQNIRRFSILQKKYKMEIKQIYLYANPEVVWSRIQQRKTIRHAGHGDITMNHEEFLLKLQSPKYAPLDIECELIKVDTSDFNQADYKKIYTLLKDSLPQKT